MRGNLWNPGNKTGRTYVGMARLIFAQNPDFPDPDSWIVEQSPGGTPDDHYVDPEGLASFIRAALDSAVVRNGGYLRIARGFLEISIAMLFRAGVEVEAVTPVEVELVEAGRELARTMVR
ncbi:DUF6086 family protein [Amycolatopsis bartoniae]|uniref:DUF6086 family protein n=1 Tax=Amycolatopsis bartoniae TaxID=941986 RepID=UPI001C849F2C|nr:DUF6086 family protein [Amycolatopsis bartoniae]